MRGMIGLCLALLCWAVAVQANYLDSNTEYAQNRFIVKLWPGVEGLQPVFDGVSAQVSDAQLSSLNAKWRVVRVERLFGGSPAPEAPQTDLPGYWRFWLEQPVDLEALLSEYATASVVEHVEPVGIHPLCYTPNDPSWPNQWYLRNTTGDHDIDAVEAWDVERGDTLAILGITDTGVQYNHTDLKGNIWRNWREYYGISGQDDDGNGFVDDSVGWDFVVGETDIYQGEDGDTADNDPKDFNGHGTHVSGIAAAQTNNGTGVCGIAGGGSGATGARIMPLRVGWTAPSGMGYVGMDFCAQGINYARQKGACVINCSWGSSNSGGLGAAVDAAVAAGMILCVAAGNDNSSAQSYLGSRGDCIDIAATDDGDLKASFSSYGSWVDVSAPGVNIYSTYSRHYVNIYDYLSGTSMATPCVTGEIGLLKSAYPSLSRAQIIQAVTENVDNIYDENPAWVGQLGSGRINLNMALLSQASLTLVQPNGGEVWMVSDIDTVRWNSENLAGTVDITINRSYTGGPWENVALNVANTGQYLWPVTVPTTTRARVRIIASSDPSVGDTSDADFTIAPANIIVESPNGAESWCAGQTETIRWRGVGLGGTVTISLNRNYPAGGWETLFSQTANDGVHNWEASGTGTSTARVRVVLDANPSLRDSSNANFTIVSPCIMVTSPDGGEFWAIGENHPVTWTSGGVTGNVEIALNRNYPAGSWETLFASTADDHTESWTVTGPFSPKSRIRVKSITMPSVYGISSGDFWIIEPNEPPDIFHDPLHDEWDPNVVITAVVRDDTLPNPPLIQLFYRAEGTTTFSRTILEATGFGDEYAALLPSLADGSYEYYIRALDMLGAADSTQLLQFDVGSPCEEEIAYDDGEGERFDWQQDTRSRWAVKLSPPSLPFALCGARFGVARAEPDSMHQPVLFEIREDNGGLPGMLVYSEHTGSVGNIIGGLPQGVPLWADVVLRDDEQNPILLFGDFFLIVGNTDSSGYEDFARDTTGVNEGRSFFFDPDASVWHNENEPVPNAHPGNRLIRAEGYVCEPPESFALLSPTSADTVWTLTPTLDWQDAASANPNDMIRYVVYWSEDSNFVQGVDSAETDSSFYSFDEGVLLSLLEPLEDYALDDELPDNVTVYWKVRAINWLGQTTWATPEAGWNFIVYLREPPVPFHLLAPPNEAVIGVLEVDLSWEATTDPDPGDSVAFYRVFLSQDSLFSQADSQTVTTTTAHWSNLQNSTTYWWRVRAYDTYGLWRSSMENWSFSVASNVPENDNTMPQQFALEQNYPNPFNPSTAIRIAVPRLSRVTVDIYDILGQKIATVANRDFEPGYHNLLWNCQNCAAGIYFVQMRTEGFVQTRKMLVVK